MKKQKRSLLQRMMVVQLCAVLVAGMLFSAEPITVLAQETTGEQENVSENDMGIERVKEPENADESESVEEPVSMVIEEAQTDNIAFGTDWVLDGSGKLTISSDAGMEDWHRRNNAYKTQVASVEIKSDVTKIGNGVFYDCSGLTNIEISEGVTEIGSDAFRKCSGLTSITIPGSVKQIGNNVFKDCSGLTSIAIPAGVTKISDGVFYGCSGLTNIEIPEGVTEIGREAFRECRGLTSIAIPAGVTKINFATFAHCSGLTSITIPDSVTEIGDGVFYGCSGLTNIEIPESVTEIGSEAFRECSGLTSIEIPAGVTKISDGVFYGCSGLTNIEIPESVIEIGRYAFMYCRRLTSIIIPDNVTSIGDWAFYGCWNLTKVIVLREMPPSIGDGVFIGCEFVDSNIKGIHVPEGKTQTYQDAWTEWKDYIVPHTHNMTPIAATPVDCTKDGNQAYYICNDCGGWFSDVAGMQKITDKDSVVINKLGHDWGEWVVKTPAAEAAPGQKERTCKRCGHTETEMIPATGSNPGNGSSVSDNNDNNDNGSNNNNDSNNSNSSNNDSNNGNSSNNNDSNNSNNSSDNNNHNSGKNDAKPDTSKEGEPKTGDAVNLELYATVAMIAGFAYLLLYFSDRERGMTEETKKELVSRIVRWAKRGGRIRKYFAFTAIFALLVYYHSIGKKICAEWLYI